MVLHPQIIGLIAGGCIGSWVIEFWSEACNADLVVVGHRRGRRSNAGKLIGPSQILYHTSSDSSIGANTCFSFEFRAAIVGSQSLICITCFHNMNRAIRLACKRDEHVERLALPT